MYLLYTTVLGKQSFCMSQNISDRLSPYLLEANGISRAQNTDVLAKLVGHGASENKIQGLRQGWSAYSPWRKAHPWPKDASPTLANCHKNLYCWPKRRLGDGM